MPSAPRSASVIVDGRVAGAAVVDAEALLAAARRASPFEAASPARTNSAATEMPAASSARGTSTVGRASGDAAFLEGAARGVGRFLRRFPAVQQCRRFGCQHLLGVVPIRAFQRRQAARSRRAAAR
jgi:hypothetical protein